MDYKEKVIALLNSKELSEEQKKKLGEIFPELKESEGERIRKAMIDFFKHEREEGITVLHYGVNIESMIAWLGKQGDANKEYWRGYREGKQEILDKYAELEKQGSEPNWCHRKVDLSNCSEEYCKAYYDGWNNCNMQHSQCKSESNDVVKCLINGMKFYYEDNTEATWGTDKFSMKIKDIIAWLEKQCESNPYSGTSFEYNGHTWGMYARDNGVEIIFDGELKAFLSSEKSFIYPIHHQSDLTSKSALEASKEEKVDNQNCVKPADKIEPKFHEGDWVVYDGWTTQIKEVYEDGYSNIHQGFIPKKREEEIRLWTIQDAKDGDVLVDEDTNVIGIFEGIEGMCWHSKLYYSCYTKELYGIECGGNHHKELAKPATKEQRDTLMKAMADAGYTFDFDKKELNKIGQKPAWSEEDEKIALSIEQVMNCASLLNIVPDKIDKIRTWLKSLKDRVLPQPKQEWNEEDEDILNTIINHFEIDLECTENDDIIRWLKSFKPQNRWKPSNEQMKVLKELIEDNNQRYFYTLLRSLYDQLKILKGE